jgi:hypothetical protein
MDIGLGSDVDLCCAGAENEWWSWAFMYHVRFLPFEIVKSREKVPMWGAKSLSCQGISEWQDILNWLKQFVSIPFSGLNGLGWFGSNSHSHQVR